MKNNGTDREEIESGRAISLYPFYPLETCLRLAEAVRGLGGDRTEIGKGLLAAHLRVQDKSPGFAQTLTSAKCYGLVAGWREYRLTEAAGRYFGSQDKNEKLRTGLVFLGNPQAFKKILSHFDGVKLPGTDILAKILQQEKMAPKSWASRTAQNFIRAAQFLGALDPDGILRWKTYSGAAPVNAQSRESDNQPRTPTPQLGPPADRTSVVAPAVIATNPDANLWVYGGGEVAIRLETPRDLTPDLWERLHSYVQILRPISPTAKKGEP